MAVTDQHWANGGLFSCLNQHIPHILKANSVHNIFGLIDYRARETGPPLYSLKSIVVIPIVLPLEMHETLKTPSSVRMSTLTRYLK